jgi:Tfp pilus assembly protein PilN
MKTTINLLPQNKKIELKNRAISRAILKTGLMLTLSLAVLATFLFFCLKVISIYQASANQEIERIKGNSDYEKIIDAQNLLEDYYSRAKKIEEDYKKQKKYWPIFQKINALAPDGIYFEEITMEGDSISLKGVGEQRDSVIKFKQALEESGFFEKIDSPISNYIQDKEVQFGFNLELKK